MQTFAVIADIRIIPMTVACAKWSSYPFDVELKIIVIAWDCGALTIDHLEILASWYGLCSKSESLSS